MRSSESIESQETRAHPPRTPARPSEAEVALQVQRDISPTLAPFGWRGRLWVGCLVVMILIGVVAYILQLTGGLAVTGLHDHVFWGVYMTNFVFFIGVSHAGTLISAILRVTNAEWRRPVTRMAEAITVFALLVGAPMVLIDMGRPDRVHHVLLDGRLQSPILWDVLSIGTYLAGSLLYLYVALIPDLGMLARGGARTKPWRRRLYGWMSLGYTGTPRQRQLLERALAVMAVIIIPVAISVHTVVSWIFGMTLRPGWHSTVFGPYFVIGAIFSGTAALLTAMALFRWIYGLEKYLTNRLFRNLGLLLLAFALLYVYFTVAEYLTLWYGSEEIKAKLLSTLMGEWPHGFLFWSWIVYGLAVPIVLLLFPVRRSIALIVIAAILVNIGMWVKRYLIIVPTLQTPYVPAGETPGILAYFPTWIEWSITGAAVAMFLLLFTLFAKLFPIISMWEVAEDPKAGGGENNALEGADREVNHG